MNISFEGKRVLVTGAGRGIGYAIAAELLKAKATVVALGRNATNLDSLKSDFPSIETICCDLTDWDATRAALENMEPVHHLVNNAAGFTQCPFENISEQEFDAIVASNMKQIVNVTQGALDASTRVLAQEYGSRGIRVNAVNPSAIMTPLMMENRKKNPQLIEQTLQRVALGRIGEPEEVAAPVVFLLSDKASMIHGVCLRIDGGWSSK